MSPRQRAVSGFAIIIVVMIAALNASADTARMTVDRVGEAGKPVFCLDGKPFYPLVYSESFSKFTSELLNQLKQQGYNSLQVAIDAGDARSKQLAAVLQACQDAELPVILELNNWRLRELLIRRPELNMVMSDGRPIEHFPDYANPATRRAHLSKIRNAAVYLRRYRNRPIVAVSVGAYDHFHLPDGEVHDDFVVPKHTEKKQTRLPYGRHVESQFLGDSVRSSDEWAALPTTSADAGSRERWESWLHFRRNLVTSWLRDTVDEVRREMKLPVGVSFDLNFAQREQFATPPYAWAEILDFVSVYCYGREPKAGYVTRLMRTVQREFGDAGVPMIGFLEFSSGLAGRTAGDEYAAACAPFVAGLMTTGPVAGRQHDDSRVAACIQWARENSTNDLRQLAPNPAEVLLVVDRQSIGLEQKIQVRLKRLGTSVDLLYVTEEWDGAGCEAYDRIVVGNDLRIPAHESGQADRRYMRADEVPPLRPQK
jgi:hypothetical protein